jgi:2-polyprenyl-3-methyl-5-hydroxy-6-metoxy-1,4-benzoquinol methylase
MMKTDDIAMQIEQHKQEVAAGERFEFGKNWAAFLRVLDVARIEEAERSLKEMLGVERLDGKTFLDIGSGSGLSSLAAHRLGARVHSFDYDPHSVACTRELHRRFGGDTDWTVESGSALDERYLQGLGRFDIVYSWGVLHHTGEMWKALELVANLVKPGGTLWLALYNDQGSASRWWWRIKKAYVSLPKSLRWLVLAPCYLRFWGPPMLKDLMRGKPMATWTNYTRHRGMSPHRDLIDWVGGFPFEVCKPEEVFDFYRVRGFEMQRLHTCAGGSGCNEFVFRVTAP